MSSLEFENKIIFGDRSEKFKTFLLSLLMKTSIDRQTAECLLNDENVLTMYKHCFTHRSFDNKNNYEYFELIGDVTSNKIIVWYLQERFPFLCNAEGVKVLARLRINLVSKLTFSNWARKLNFEPFISYDLETKIKQENSVLEDCFEAFIGCTEKIIDEHIRGYTANYFCFKFIELLLDEEDIKLSYKSLYDPITRLKETFDFYNSTSEKGTCPYIHGTISFTHEKIETGKYLVRLIQSSLNKKEVLLEETGNSIIDLKYNLCQKYLDFLEEKGFKKAELKYYEEIETKRINHEIGGKK
jgi:hypothetical protein